MVIPKIEGSAAIRSTSSEFAEGLRSRVEAGLLTGAPHPRSNYSLSDIGAGGLRIRADDGWTAINVGLNDFEVGLERSGAVRYEVRYWRWATYVLGLCDCWVRWA